MPDDWKVTPDNERLTAESPDGEFTLVVSPLADKEADLLDEDVTDFVDDEIDNMKVTSDRRDTLAGVQARILEGTGTDVGNIVFKAVALDPGENDAVIEMVIYGDPEELNKGKAKAAVDKILDSFKPPASADTRVNGCGNYSIWVPGNWKITLDKERLTAESRDDEISLVVAPLNDKEAALVDEDVSDFIDDEIADMKVTSDRRDTLAGVRARILEGTGTDDGNIIFKAVALDPSTNAAVIEMLIYGDPTEMNRPANKAIVDQILRSFKPN